MREVPYRRCAKVIGIQSMRSFVVFAFLIEHNGLNRAMPERGRFRVFLLASVKNFMSNEWRKSNTLKRGGGMRSLSLDEVHFSRKYERQLSDNCSADLLFEKSWVESLLARVLENLKQDYEKAGKSQLYDALSGYLIPSSDKPPQSQIAMQLGLSVPAVTMSLQRMRKRYGVILRQEIEHTVGSPDDVDDELMKLKALVVQSP